MNYCAPYQGLQKAKPLDATKPKLSCAWSDLSTLALGGGGVTVISGSTALGLSWWRVVQPMTSAASFKLQATTQARWRFPVDAGERKPFSTSEQSYFRYTQGLLGFYPSSTRLPRGSLKPREHQRVETPLPLSRLDPTRPLLYALDSTAPSYRGFVCTYHGPESLNWRTGSHLKRGPQPCPRGRESTAR